MTSSLRDGFGRAIGSRDQDDNLTRTKFNPTGRPVETINALSQSTTFVYDLLDRQTEMTAPVVGTTYTVFTASTGRVASQEDAKGNETTFMYDVLGRRSSVTDRLNQQTTYLYDTAGRLGTMVDAESRETSYTYDKRGRRKTTTLEDGSVTTLVYDSAGRQSKVTKNSGVEQRFTYQAMTGVLEQVDFYDATPALAGSNTFSYDAYLRPIGSTGKDGADHSLAYTEQGQLKSDTTTYSGQSYAVNYAYYDNGSLKDVTYPSGRKTAYDYTNRGQLDTIDWDGSQIENRGYDALGRYDQCRSLLHGRDTSLRYSRSLDIDRQYFGRHGQLHLRQQ